MRAKIVFGLLLSFLLGIGIFTGLKIAAASKPPVDASDAGPAGSASGRPKAGPGPQDAGKDGSAPVVLTPPPGVPLAFPRPLRVTSLGWEIIAPGFVANSGLLPTKGSEFLAAGLPVLLGAVDSMDRLESALARGGTDPQGCDIALLPLPLFVASYERLRALDPQVFFVVGWSRGREAILATTDSLTSLPAGGDVPLIVAGGDLPFFLGMFLLDSAGVELSRVHELPAKTPRSEDVQLAAIDRVTMAEAIDGARRKILFTSADAPQLIPFVAIAPRPLVEQNSGMLALWARIWMDGDTMLRGDVSGAARQLSSNPGSPEPINLIARIGQIERASASDNAALFGLSGRRGLTVPDLFQHTWAIWRSAGAVATTAPAQAPVSDAVVADLVRSLDARLGSAAPTETSNQAGPSDAKPLVVRHLPDTADAQRDLLPTLAFLADMFARSTIRVSVARNETAHVLDELQSRYDLPRSRFVAGSAPGQDLATIEILPPR